MKISEMISRLRKIKAKHGDLNVVSFSHAMYGGEPVVKAATEPGGLTRIDKDGPFSPQNLRKAPPTKFVVVGDKYTYEGRDW